MATTERLKTEEVISCYIQYRLAQRMNMEVPGLDCKYLENGLENHPVLTALRNLAISLRRYKAVQDLFESYRKKSEEILKQKDCRIASEYFTRCITISFFANHGPLSSPDYSWSRVALAIDVTSQLAENAAECRNFEKVKRLIDWIRMVFDKWEVSTWVENQGGWEQLPRVANDASKGEWEDVSELPAPSFSEVNYVKDILGQTRVIQDTSDINMNSLSMNLPHWHGPLPQLNQIPHKDLPKLGKGAFDTPFEELLKKSYQQPIPWPPGIEVRLLLGDPSLAPGFSAENFTSKLPENFCRYYDVADMPEHLAMLEKQGQTENKAHCAGEESPHQEGDAGESH